MHSNSKHIELVKIRIELEKGDKKGDHAFPLSCIEGKDSAKE